MSEAPLHSQLVSTFDGMPAQLQAAARWALDHPHDVALLTVREQARRAGVVPATMTRLAKRLGFDGYDAIKDLYADGLRRRGAGFSGKTEALLARRRLKGEAALAFDLADGLAHQMAALSQPAALAQIAAAARAIGKARRVYALGQRSSYPVAFHFAYVLGLAGIDARLLDGPGATGSDGLRGTRKGDVLVAVSVKPYTRATVQTTRYAARQGAAVVAITDSTVSPLAREASASIIVPTESPSFFHTMTPAFAAAEALAALVAAAAGASALEAVQQIERQFAALSTHLQAGSGANGRPTRVS
jgi:DNA-binding MurR/RpiR family transcriptional regulator